ncbi:MAG: LacI family DNA-binding transcriptional regulator [Propionivibrio sp.]
MANIKDVALHAGVSVTTVSHVVNGTRFVSETARQRVEEAVRELGYVPSAVARSLKHNTTRTFGMIIPNNSNPYFAEIIRGVEDRCFAAGYNVILCNSNDDPERQASYLRVLAEKRIDGLVLVVTGSDAVARATLGGINIPLVLLDREVSGLSGDLVEVNHVLGSQMATRHLLELGHPRVACISGPPGLSPSSQRRAGWKDALEQAGVERKESDLARGDFTARGGYLAMQTLLKRRPRPTAVFACNDLMAFGALAAAREAGIAVPQQLSIVGFDDIELAAFSAPPLTTVAQPKLKIGTLAAELLLERVSAGRSESRRVILDPEIRIRGTAAPYQPTKENA